MNTEIYYMQTKMGYLDNHRKLRKMFTAKKHLLNFNSFVLTMVQFALHSREKTRASYWLKEVAWSRGNQWDALVFSRECKANCTISDACHRVTQMYVKCI